MRIKYLCVFSVMFFYGWAHAAEPLKSEIVVTVNGVSITRKQVGSEVSKLMPKTYFHRNVDAERQKELRKKALNNLIEKELKIQEADRLGLKVDQKEIDTELDKVIERFPNRKAFEEGLSKDGFTVEDVVKEIRRKRLAEMVYRTEVLEKVHVSETDALSYYEKNKDKFVQPVQYHLKNILLRVPPLADQAEKNRIEERARTIAEKIKQGMPFEEAVEVYSEGADKEKGGDMGFLHKGRLAPDVEKEILTLKPGETAGPFLTFRGYYLFRLEGMRPERLSPFEEVREALIRDLREKTIDERTKAWLEALKSSSKIEVKDPSYLDDTPPSDPSGN